jgi:hypothetical protein
MSTLVVLASSFSSLFADQESLTDQNEDKDYESIRQYIEAKRDIAIRQKGGQLHIGGNVRVQYSRVHQVLDGIRVEGQGKGGDRRPGEPNIPQNYGDIEAALSFRYINNKSDADLLFKFSNHAGLDTTNYSDASRPSEKDSRLSYKNYQPTGNKISLARAVIGYELWDKEGHKIAGQVGRQRLYDLFDSRVMFVSRFDGIALKYSSLFDKLGKAHLTWGCFIVADRTSHYAHAIEGGLSQVLGTPFSVKLAVIDWARNGKHSDGSQNSGNEMAINNAGANYYYLNKLTNYTVSQALVTYDVPRDWTMCGNGLKLYAAYLKNHKARGLKEAYSGRDKDNKNDQAWYAGLTLGRIQLPGDYAFDACYQYVGAQAVPEMDSHGGRGNLTGIWGVIDPSQGYTNYKGVRAQLAYALTADMLVNLKGVITKAADAKMDASSIGSSRRARNDWQALEVELAYAF